MPPTETRTRLLPLGTGSILMGAGRSAAGYLLEVDGERTLVDCGPGTLLRLSQAGIDAATIDHVVLSHFHPDHHADLIGLLFYRHSPFLTERHALQVVAPPGFARIHAAWSSVYDSWVGLDDAEIVEVGEGVHSVGRLEVHAFHARHALPAYCYRFETSGGRAFAYSGDSDVCDGLVAACSGTDFCWLECSFADEDAVSGHLTPSRVRGVLERSAPRRAGLTHFYPSIARSVASEPGFFAQFAGLETEVVALEDLVEVAL